MTLFDSTTDQTPHTPGESGSHRCHRCGRPLTDPDSIARGMGPVCASKAGLTGGRPTGAAATGDSRGYTDEFLNLDIVEAGLVMTSRSDEDGHRKVQTNIPHLVERHSPDGFEYGYGGSGPADLALNAAEVVFQRLAADGEIDHTETSEFWSTDDEGVRDGLVSKAAMAHYQDFKARFVAPASRKGGRVSWERLKAWAKKRLDG